MLLGAVGGPKWDDPTAKVRPERGLLALRKGLGVFANLRPVKVHPALIEASPLKPEKLAGVDMLVVRELTGGLYFGQPKGRAQVDGHARAVDTLEYTDYEIERVVRAGLPTGRRRGARKSPRWIRPMCSNPRGCGGRWPRRCGQHIPDVALEHVLVDTAAMRLITGPASFRCGRHREHVRRHPHRRGLGAGRLDGHAALGLAGRRSAARACTSRSTAPRRISPARASPTRCGTILSAAMLLRHSLGLESEARAIEAAVENAIARRLPHPRPGRQPGDGRDDAEDSR